METSENKSSWDQIRQGVKDAETLIGQKQYNLSMIKCRQTLEFMVRCLAEKACVLEGDLNDTYLTNYTKATGSPKPPANIIIKSACWETGLSTKAMTMPTTPTRHTTCSLRKFTPFLMTTTTKPPNRFAKDRLLLSPETGADGVLCRQAGTLPWTPIT